MRSRVVGPVIGTFVVSNPTVQQTQMHSIASANINASSGAFVAFGDGTSTPANISQLQLSYTASEPLAFRIAATALLAASASKDDWVLNQGDGPVNIYKAIPSGSFIWVRSKSSNSVTSGYISANMMG